MKNFDYLESGKRYRARNGKTYGPLIESPNGNGFLYPPYRFDSDDIFDWYPDGRFTVHGESPNDLVELIENDESTVDHPAFKTTRKLQSGQYGILHVSHSDRWYMSLKNDYNGTFVDPKTSTKELREAAELMILIADYFDEENSK